MSPKLISHRGNTNGPNQNLENSIEYIESAIIKGFDVEIDVMYIENKFYFGHDKPQYLVDRSYIDSIKDKAWFHCKNFDALYEFSKMIDVRYFWHENDSFTLTSNDFIWTYPGKTISDRSIIVDLTWDAKLKNKLAYGICGDYLE